MCKWICGFGKSSTKSSYGVDSQSPGKSSVSDIPGLSEEAKVESPSESYKRTKDSTRRV